jgi:hypothetical protein
MADEKDKPQSDIEETGGERSGPILHGGEGDPLGGGVAELEDSDEVTEGVPQQES